MFTISSNFISSIFQNLMEIVLLAKSVLTEYAVSRAKQALSNSFLYKCFRFLVSLNFRILSQCLIKGPQAL